MGASWSVPAPLSGLCGRGSLDHMPIEAPIRKHNFPGEIGVAHHQAVLMESRRVLLRQIQGLNSGGVLNNTAPILDVGFHNLVIRGKTAFPMICDKERQGRLCHGHLLHFPRDQLRPSHTHDP